MYVMSRGYEVEEALRAQMEMQSKLHLQVEVLFYLAYGIVILYPYPEVGHRK